MKTINLTEPEVAYLVATLNLELRQCDPRGYPDSGSPVLSPEGADLRNGLYRKLVGRDHTCYRTWREYLKPTDAACGEPAGYGMPPVETGGELDGEV